MLTISKPLSASQAQTYHAKEFTAAEQNYWRQDGATLGEWHGKLAARFELAGAVGAEQFARLSEGQNPNTAEELIQHRAVQEYENADGKSVAAEARVFEQHVHGERAEQEYPQHERNAQQRAFAEVGEGGRDLMDRQSFRNNQSESSEDPHGAEGHYEGR